MKLFFTSTVFTLVAVSAAQDGGLRGPKNFDAKPASRKLLFAWLWPAPVIRGNCQCNPAALLAPFCDDSVCNPGVSQAACLATTVTRNGVTDPAPCMWPLPPLSPPPPGAAPSTLPPLTDDVSLP